MDIASQFDLEAIKARNEYLEKKLEDKETIIETCYALCESCQSCKEGEPSIVQNYLDEVYQHE